MRNLEIHFHSFCPEPEYRELFYVQATASRSFSISNKNGGKSSYNLQPTTAAKQTS